MTTTTPTQTTSNKRQEFAAALADLVLPPNATDAEIDLLTEKIREVAAPSATVALKITRPPPTPAPKPAHADICIERVIGGRTFRFRGFIREDDRDGYVFGDTMLERVRATGDTPSEREDNEHMEKHLAEWVNDPELAPYYMVTNERHPEYSRVVRCFDRGSRERGWLSLGLRFDRDGLVACRAA